MQLLCSRITESDNVQTRMNVLIGSTVSINLASGMIQVTSSLVVTSDKIKACSVYKQQAYLRAARVSVAPRLRDHLNTKDADVTSLPT